MMGEIEWQLHQRLLVALQCAADWELLAGAQQPLTLEAVCVISWAMNGVCVCVA